jgi:hypothetical protein
VLQNESSISFFPEKLPQFPPNALTYASVHLRRSGLNPYTGPTLWTTTCSTNTQLHFGARLLSVPPPPSPRIEPPLLQFSCLRVAYLRDEPACAVTLSCACAASLQMQPALASLPAPRDFLCSEPAFASLTARACLWRACPRDEPGEEPECGEPA